MAQTLAQMGNQTIHNLRKTNIGFDGGCILDDGQSTEFTEG